MKLKLSRKVVIISAFIIIFIVIAVLICSFFSTPFAGCADGTFYGEARGIRKHLVTEVIIKNEKIVSIEIIEHYEKGSHHYKLPMEQIPADIIKRQSLSVDIVAGSTMTCNGIIDSVADALEKAKIKTE